jgi:hypothetical protein
MVPDTSPMPWSQIERGYMKPSDLAASGWEIAAGYARGAGQGALQGASGVKRGVDHGLSSLAATGSDAVNAAVISGSNGEHWLYSGTIARSWFAAVGQDINSEDYAERVHTLNSGIYKNAFTFGLAGQGEAVINRYYGLIDDDEFATQVGGTGIFQALPALGRGMGRNWSSGSAALAESAEAAEMRAYGGPGGGHHVPAKGAFTGAAGYDPNAALAIPNAEMARLGVNHLRVVTPAQRALYIAYARTGAPLTWEAAEAIETQALIRGGMHPGMARATVQKAIQSLKDAGVSGPTRIPWSGH